MFVAALGPDYDVNEQVAIHANATVEEGAVLKGPVVVCDGALVAAQTYLRGGVYIGPRSSIGPGCELKSSLLFQDSVIAHLGFVGDQLSVRA